MKLRLLSWNVRGANDSSKRKVIKAMIRSQRVDLFCLQETKIQAMTQGLVRSLGIGRFLDWGILDAHGSAGGLLICWDKRTLEVIEMEVGNFSISCRERSNQRRLTSAMRRFAQVVDELELINLPLQGGVLTWSGGRNNQAWARLDRFLVTQNWLDHFNEVVQSRGLREVFGRLESNKNSTLQQVEFWDGMESERSLSEGETELKKEAKDSFKKWVLMEETHWRQLSRELWLKEGDRNIGFFHRMANAHRMNNSLDRIKINGVWMTEDQEGLHLNRLNSREAEVLEMPFIEEEIYAALMDMNGDKALGPDGFTIGFWQSSWELVKEEIMDLFREFYDQRSFAKSLNSTFLVLIPKKGGAKDLGDFRPISLLGSLYKILAKVLVNRLKKVLDKVVSGDQNAFVRGKQILDASLIANEGLRQGDPFSLYLFVLGMEVLSNLIRRAVDGGFLSGCRIQGRGEEEMIVSHLLFADDTIIFCEARKEQLSALSWILAWFEASSGLRINLDKSVLIPVDEVEEIEEMAMELGCKVGLLPTVYLGCPLFTWGCPLEPTTKLSLYGMGWKRE
ncbi:LINE-1 reverse transcriptase-like [Vitis vinifera]|uniref:LINE-1 reverse transcriptase-like n=1 Tax=Vitis vinifera TaxID=29760 RepID=A0A438JVF0_VITVI|nr:LINE-1 reverse transcriptase-like [Vitis vinifera]